MSLVATLEQDMKTAMRNKEKDKLAVIRMVRAAIKKVEIDLKRPLNDEEVLDVITREVKQRKDSIAGFEKAGRSELAAKEQGELEILQVYLPAQLSDEELRQIVVETVEQLGATSKAEMGKVMGTVLPKVKGRADGKKVSQIVNQTLS
ncbi:hypothetical protein SAMN05444392_102216 [Seinonella peptonophila]|uniref:GatB/YqeY domain-containing protein n=1 Tax=Seinonella peptonophila TaxID=112248 RepID=A0A1M4V7W5_9BACL|nr:GatB/YqeY domain-containing protein [Seinonella peptonophila]SHE64980.1 hypothetical protein SAMN05444392_102216 [Seinonella peptonophila]